MAGIAETASASSRDPRRILSLLALLPVGGRGACARGKPLQQVATSVGDFAGMLNERGTAATHPERFQRAGGPARDTRRFLRIDSFVEPSRSILENVC